MPTEISTPFRIGGDGRVVTVSDPDVQVRQHVHALINTIPEERVTVPGYGVDIQSLLFENNRGNNISDGVSARISDAFAAWEPGITLVSLTPDPNVPGDEYTRVDVQYSRKDAADSAVVANSNEAIIGATGVVKEIVRG